MRYTMDEWYAKNVTVGTIVVLVSGEYEVVAILPTDTDEIVFQLDDGTTLTAHPGLYIDVLIAH